MSFSIDQNGLALNVVMYGAVNLSESSQIKDSFEKLMSPEIAEVTLDASQVEYIDSSGVASLLYMNKQCAKLSKTFNIKSISESAARVINLAKLDSILGINSSKVIKLSTVNSSSISFSELDAISIFEAKN